MSSKRKRFSEIMSLLAVYEHLSIAHQDELCSIFDEQEAKIEQLQSCIRESAELKAETLRLAERRAWEAGWEYCQKQYICIDAKEFNGMSAYQCMKRDFDDWNREREGR